MQKTSIPLGALMVDIRGQTLTAEEQKFLRHPAVGAVILFARNHESYAQTAALAKEIKALRTPPLLIAVDQEGGDVQRLRNGFHALPAPARIGEWYARDRARALSLARTAGQLMAAEVHAAGIDFSFAPVLDIANARSNVIGARAFADEPNAVCALAGAYVDGMRAAGMAAVGKHFPGHGGVAADSHHELPRDSRAFAEIESRDLIPFAKLTPKLSGVMSAHILFENIDARAPTYSKFWLQKILRAQLKFHGAIFSDDLSMQGAHAEKMNAPARAAAALTAGCDFALLCNAEEDARAAAAHLGDARRPRPRLAETLRARPPAPGAESAAQLAEKLAAQFSA